jgi:hypothetical protein
MAEKSPSPPENLRSVNFSRATDGNDCLSDYKPDESKRIEQARAWLRKARGEE